MVSVYSLATPSVVHGPVASVAPGEWLEMQMPWCHPRLIKSEPLGVYVVQESAFDKPLFSLAIITFTEKLQVQGKNFCSFF